jgi:bifunctional non-homologous end joining protein LigD
MGLEGLVAKRADAPYRSGRSDAWVKVKCVKSETFPIVAFIEKLGARPRKIASLYVGKTSDRLVRNSACSRPMTKQRDVRTIRRPAG